MITLYITRHGETEWNTERRMQGQNNSPLTRLGISQAMWLADRMSDIEIDTIYSSPLGRALDTSKLIAQRTGGKIIERNELKEIYLGDWEGRLISEVEIEEPERHYNFWHEPQLFHVDGKETFEHVKSRVSLLFDEVVSTYNQVEKNINILFVAHAIVLKGLLNYLNNDTIENYWKGPHILPTSLTKIEIKGSEMNTILLSDTSHYKEDMKFGWFIDEKEEK